MKFVIGSSFAVALVSAYSTRLDDCQTFAALFDGTCGGVESNSSDDYQYTDSAWSENASGDSFNCAAQVDDGDIMLCPNAVATAQSCTVQRKNCVTCYRDSSTDIVYI